MTVDERMFLIFLVYTFLIFVVTLETIEVDFTDSVSLILHQLQQERPLETRSSSITISEENIDDDDESDNENDIIQSTTDEQIDKICHSTFSAAFIPMDTTKFVQTDLSFHTNDTTLFTKGDEPNKRNYTSNSSTSINELDIDKTDRNIDMNKKRPIIQSSKTSKKRKYLLQ